MYHTKYTLEEWEICNILNEVLGNWWVLFPFNHRFKAQQKFIKILESRRAETKGE